MQPGAGFGDGPKDDANRDRVVEMDSVCEDLTLGHELKLLVRRCCKSVLDGMPRARYGPQLSRYGHRRDVQTKERDLGHGL